MKVAIIPARGGSKRILRKNIKSFYGKEMIGWSIDAALKCNLFEKVIVSTDDDEIARVAEMYGAEVPFCRPAHLSDDYTGTVPVIAHAIEELRKIGIDPLYACCIYATAPFVKATDIGDAFEVLLKSNAEYVVSVTKYHFPIQRALKINTNGRLQMFNHSNLNVRSQDLEVAYHDAGQFYWGLASAWSEGNSVFSGATCPFILPSYRVQDIDTIEDWERAEMIFKYHANEFQ